MLVIVSAIAVVAVLSALVLGVQLHLMRQRALYWENEVKRDSLIRHQWLRETQPSRFSYKLRRTLP